MKYEINKEQRLYLCDILEILTDKKMYFNEKNFRLKVCEKLYYLGYYKEFSSLTDAKYALEYYSTPML